MRLLLAKACEYSAQLVNGRQSMVGLFENIVAPHMPVDHPAFYFCVQLEFDPMDNDDQMDLKVILIDEDGKPVVDFAAQGVPPKDPNGGMTRLFVQFHNPAIRFEKVGEYRFDVLYNGRKIGEERVPVLIVQPTA